MSGSSEYLVRNVFVPKNASYDDFVNYFSIVVYFRKIREWDKLVTVTRRNEAHKVQSMKSKLEKQF
jgi:hypothetical protein